MENKSEWILVTDRLPSDTSHVLVKYLNDPLNGKIYGVENFEPSDGWSTGGVRAWMPIPKFVCSDEDKDEQNA